MPANPFQSGLSVQVSGDATGANNALQSVMGNLTSMKGLALGAGVAIAAAIGVKSVNAAREFQDAMNESLAIMGDVSDAMREDMSQAARDVATQTRFSAEEAAESYFFLASAGLDAKESIEALPQVAQFAQAGMFDMATATDLLTDAQSALGKTMEDPQENMEEMARLSDILVKANTLANASVEQFSEALTNKAAPAMRNNNIATEEGVAVLAAFADAGLKGRRAGTILARTIQGLQKRARENADAFEEFGIRVFDADGEMRSFADISGDMTEAFKDMSPEARSAAFEQLGFNRRTRRGVNLLIGQEEALRDYKSGLEDAGGTTEDVANKQMESFNAQLDLLMSELNDLAITIGNAVLPALTELVKGLKTVIGAVNDVIAGMKELKDEARDMSTANQGLAGSWQSVGEAGLAASDDVSSASTAIQEDVEPAINKVGGLENQFNNIKKPVKDAADAVKTQMSDAEDAVDSFIDTFDELRRGAAQRLSLRNVERLIEEELPTLMEGVREGGLEGEQARLAIALQDAKDLLEAEDGPTRITDLPKDVAAPIAAELARRQREEQQFRQEIFERIQDFPFRRLSVPGAGERGGPPGVGFRVPGAVQPERQVKVLTEVEVRQQIEGTDDLGRALARSIDSEVFVDTANQPIIEREERTDRFNPGA